MRYMVDAGGIREGRLHARAVLMMCDRRYSGGDKRKCSGCKCDVEVKMCGVVGGVGEASRRSA